jgi:hypothetical protein
MIKAKQIQKKVRELPRLKHAEIILIEAPQKVVTVEGLGRCEILVFGVYIPLPEEEQVEGETLQIRVEDAVKVEMKAGK